MEDIKIIDFLCGKCPYMGCQYNDLGMCLNDNEDFLLNIFDKIRDIYENNDFGKLLFQLSISTFECEPKLNDHTCKYCGNHLKYTIDYVPYSDIYTPMKTWYCPLCD